MQSRARADVAQAKLPPTAGGPKTQASPYSAMVMDIIGRESAAIAATGTGEDSEVEVITFAGDKCDIYSWASDSQTNCKSYSQTIYGSREWSQAI